MAEIERLDTVAGDAGVVQDVLLRVTVGVEAHTHEFIATAHEDQKFGLSLASGAAMVGVRRVFATDHLRLVGLHSHIGSQIFDVAGFELAAHRVIGLGTQLDTARFRSLIAEAVKLPPTQVSALILGEHGDSMVPIWSTAQAAGLPLDKFPGWSGSSPTTSARTPASPRPPTTSRWRRASRS